MIQKVTRGWLAHKGADIASASTADLGAVEGLFHDITGSTTITSFGTVSAGIWKVLKYEGAVPLTHNATSLILLDGASRVTADGDTQIVVSEGSGNWREIAYHRAAVAASAGFSTGDVKVTFKTVADTGWVLMNDGTIGNAASGGTTRANADTAALFTLIWNNTVDADCAVSTGRGANAAADYAANKTIALPKSLGRELAIAGSGAGLTARALASVLGTETKTIAAANLPASGVSVPSLSVSTSGVSFTRNTHDANPAGTNYPTFLSNNNTTGGSLIGETFSSGTFAMSGTTGTGTTGNMGSGTAFDVMTPRFHANVMIKL